MLLSDTVGRPVVSSSDAARVGTVAGLVVDTEEARVTALRLDGVKGRGDVVAWADVDALGPDAVVVAAATAARFASADSGKDQDLLGKRLLTDLGDAVGTVADLAFDPASGRVDALHTSRGARVPGADLLGIGAYAVVVRAAALPHEDAGA
ncbi:MULTISPECIES: PRC-barrel domain-containing protein [Streptomyces]|uniref:PRC-barrel domain-containing protein n=1 Tax=Streptomyces TaxID=1883 RepID=UPI0006EB38C3|nr:MULTISPECIES: PRC-barrel domain-containing protein [Streptomyces]